MKLKYISSDLKAMYISSEKKQSQYEITIEQVKKHLEALVEDTLMIESGRIAVPKYETFIERKVRTKHRGRTQVVLEGLTGIWEGRLEEHFQVLRCDNNPNTSCKSCSKVLPPP
ncbi:hypothetical protein EV2_027503 [Malus domestica]